MNIEDVIDIMIMYAHGCHKLNDKAIRKEIGEVAEPVLKYLEKRNREKA